LFYASILGSLLFLLLFISDSGEQPYISEISYLINGWFKKLSETFKVSGTFQKSLIFVRFCGNILMYEERVFLSLWQDKKSLYMLTDSF